MLWLNAGIQKKKKDIKIDGNNSNDHIKRIRQLLSAAWSEDLKINYKQKFLLFHKVYQFQLYKRLY